MELYAELFSVLQTMATKVEAERFLSQNFLKAILCTLSFGDVNLDVCSANVLTNLLEFFRVVKLRKEAIQVVLLLKDEWRCEQE